MTDGGSATMDGVAGEALQARARELLEALLGQMGLAGSVEVIERDDHIELAISGSEPSIVVGRKGQTLDALQYLLNRMVTRELGEHKLLVVNADGYRERREASLLELAERLSEKAQAEGKIVALEPMSARDRRVIHLALRDHPGVFTRSEGEGDDRRLLIVPEGSAAGREAATDERAPLLD